MCRAQVFRLTSKDGQFSVERETSAIETAELDPSLIFEQEPNQVMLRGGLCREIVAAWWRRWWWRWEEVWAGADGMVVVTSGRRGHDSPALFRSARAPQVLDALLPLYLNGCLLRSLQESLASELAARMNAMSSASDNAKELKKVRARVCVRV